MSHKDNQYLINIKCNETAKSKIEDTLEIMKNMGDIGASRSVEFEEYGNVFFDGDGPDRIYEVQTEPLKMSSFKDIPNYRHVGEDASKRCGTCGAFNDGYCEMFQAEVESDYTCDDWVPEGEYKTSSLKDSLIKLGSKYPNLQSHIRPILDYLTS